MSAPRLTKDAARRNALAAQGFDRPRPARVDARSLRRVNRQLGVIQLDSVCVVCRAHYMPHFSRLGPYDRDRLDAIAWTIGGNELFEYWGHEASLLTFDHRPLMAHRMEAFRPWKSVRQVAEDHPEYLDAVVDELRERGPLSCSELDDPGERTGPWWGYNKGKHALEYLFAKGVITAVRRRDFTRVYGLPEQLLPPDVLAQPPVDANSARRELLLRSARFHGVGTAADLADVYRIRTPVARPVLEQLADEGALQRVDVDGWRGPVYLHPEARRPRAIRARALLAPFDPVVWCRPRIERLFDFHYRIEIYVPREKRVHGYYVLPFLLGDRLVGRADVKADRKAGVLRVPGAWIEDSDRTAEVAPELAAELVTLAGWLGLERVVCGRKGSLIQALRMAL